MKMPLATIFGLILQIKYIERIPLKTYHKLLTMFGFFVLVSASVVFSVIFASPLARGQEDQYAVPVRFEVPVQIQIVGGEPFSGTTTITLTIQSSIAFSGSTPISVTSQISSTNISEQFFVDAQEVSGLILADAENRLSEVDSETDTFIEGTVNRSANLRVGPGTNFGVAGSVGRGDSLVVRGSNLAGDWYQIENGDWIAAFLVDLPSSTTVPTLEPTVAPTNTATPRPTRTPTFTPTVRPTSTPRPTPTPSPTPDPSRILKSVVGAVIERNNRGVTPAFTIDVFRGVDSAIITIQWAINDNLTERMTKSGAKIDATDIVKAIANSDVDYELLNLEGTFSLIDTYGNTSEEVVVWLTFTPATVNRINWENFLWSNIYDVADSSNIRPVFQD